MRDTIDMAREAGDEEWKILIKQVMKHFPDEVERFAGLVRADEQEKYKWDIHSCGPTCKRYACVAMREAVEAEREACAQYAENHDLGTPDGHDIAVAIRARGNT
jgi:hypothetical protein